MASKSSSKIGEMDKDKGVEEATTSNSSAVEQNKKETEKQEKTDVKRVPFYKLFSFADSTDKTLMIIGSIAAIGNGVCMPLMTVIFGDLVDAFGENQNPKEIVHVVSQVSVAAKSFSSYTKQRKFEGNPEV